ncbi:hypothetical protein K505DRAFT_372056 [Melanomma pulvis-pyrius CBS 109.77]|uniref:CorA-like transporter domain-containing protein n=1 Tax=Melanomma pulvis-pyrius CBS 109.77 TaxID=1314802 RepID=A0A6A6XNX6_9PLEO|nr:hypothetical protein K505DRAFT_372056 [Melanomma pulvis-pyrius CBS 109.77]
MMEAVVDHHDIFPQIFSLMSCFKDRSVQTDDGYCSPVNSRYRDRSSEICYSIKYAEFKEAQRHWVIRQTGVYHQYRAYSKQSIWIIISPVPASLLERRIKDSMQRLVERVHIATNPLALHAFVISTYFSNWKDYCGHYELTLEQLYSDAATTELESTLQVTHESLQQVGSLTKRFSPLRAIFISFGLVLQTLEEMNNSRIFNTQQDQNVSAVLSNLRNEASTYLENSKFILETAKNVRHQISQTLNLKNQDVMQKQSDSLVGIAISSARDSVAIRIITILTLGYLPFTFVATVMGMNFFAMDPSTHHVMVSPQFWIYFCLSIPMTALTILLWRRNTQKAMFGKEGKRSSVDAEKLVGSERN